MNMPAEDNKQEFDMILDEARSQGLKVMARCVIVQLNISHKTFATKLSPQDLGWDDEKAVKNYLNAYAHLGVKLLLPPGAIAKIKRVEGQARRALEKYSFKSPFGWAVPFDAIRTWAKQNRKHEAEFNKVKQSIIDDYPDLVEEALHAHIEAAKKIFDMRWPGGKDAPMPRKDFVLSVIEAVRQRTPSQEEVESSFGYKCHFLMMEPPDEQDSETIKEVTKELMAREEGRKAAAELAEYWKRESTSLLNDVVGGVQSKVFTTMQTAISRACDILDSKNKLTAKSANSLLAAIKSVESLNVLDDKQLCNMAQEIKEVIGAEPIERQSMVRKVKGLLDGFDQTLRIRMMELDIPAAARKPREQVDMPEEFMAGENTVSRLRARPKKDNDQSMALAFDSPEIKTRQIRRAAS